MITDEKFKYIELKNEIDHYSETTDYGFNRFMDADKIADAYYNAQKTNSWKKMTQSFLVNYLKSIKHIQLALMTGTYEQEPFYEFDINERGKSRHIRAQVINDRVVQRDVCDNIVAPSVMHLLIYDNGASVKSKGISFSRNRMSTHLIDYVKHHGTTGWVLQIDFKKFFDSIPHRELIESLQNAIDDKEAMSIIIQLIGAFSNGEFNETSLGIGSQISQLCGVYYPTRIDNYCKIVRGLKYYGRYMDDIYIIHYDKKVLEDVLDNIIRISKEMKLTVHEKKTHITPLSKGFTFLKIKYNVLESGKILRRIVPKTIAREKRKLKKYKMLFDSGKMSYEDIENSFKSWYGNYKIFDSRKSVHEILRLFMYLFKEEIRLYSKDANLIRLSFVTSTSGIY